MVQGCDGEALEVEGGEGNESLEDETSEEISQDGDVAALVWG